jgi:hypothetical protein
VLNRRLAAAVLLAAAGLAASGCAGQQAALRVNDESVSQAELFEELELITTNENFRNLLGLTEPVSSLQGELQGGFSQSLVSAALNQRVVYLLADDVLADNDVEVTDEDRQSIVDQIDGALEGGSESLPAAYREDFVEGLARLTRLQQELGQDDAGRQLQAAAQDADIHVASQFGSWDPDQLVISPPPGATPAPGSADDGGSGAGSDSSSG